MYIKLVIFIKHSTISTMKFLSLLPLVAIIYALPAIKDTHSTTLEMLTNGKVSQGGEFRIGVRRVDDLVDDVADSIVAERVKTVVLNFNVNLGGEVSVNGNAVSIGLSNLVFEAYTVNEYDAAYLESTKKKELDESYDVGIIGMTVQVIPERAEILKGIFITKLTLIQQITEMNGVEVEQSTVMMQMFEISATEVTAHTPRKGTMSSEMAKEAQKQRAYHHHRGYKMARKFGYWFKTQATQVRVLFSILMGTLIGLLVVSLVSLISGFFAYVRGYKRVPSYSSFHGPLFPLDTSECKLKSVAAEKEIVQ
jgi:hypothetical protein